MIKKGLLDFLKCMKYYFVPLGILAIFTVIGLHIGINGIVSTIKNFFTEAGRIVNQAKIDWEGIWGAFIGEITKLEFTKDFNNAISTLISEDWIINTLKVVAKSVFGDSLNFEELTNLATQTVGSIVLYVVLFFVMILLGIVIGIFVVKLLLRKELTRVRIGKLILFTVLDALFWLALIIIFNLLSAIASWVAIVLLVIFILSFVFLCLLEGYLFYARKKVPFTKVVNIKNVLKLYLIEIMIFAITASISVILILVFKIFVGFFIALPIIEIGIIASSLEAENYVVNLVDESTTDPSLLLYRGNL